jgi:hypothetical protein
MSVILMDSLGWHDERGTEVYQLPTVNTRFRWFSSTAGVFSDADPQRGTLPYYETNASKIVVYDLPEDKAGQVLIVGFWFKKTGFSSTDWFFSLRNGESNTSEQFHLGTDTSSRLIFYRGATIATGTTTLAVDTWYHLEMKVKVANSISAGEGEIRLNGSGDISLGAGTDTQGQSNDSVTHLALGDFAFGGTISISQLYVMDTSGTFANDFLGPQARIDVLYPNDNGFYSGFVGSDGNSIDNYLLIDNSGVEDDSEYVGATGVNVRDSYKFESLQGVPNASGIQGVQILSQMAKWGGTEPRTSKQFVRYNSNDFDASETYFLSSGGYEVFYDIYGSNPSGLTQWTTEEVNNIEAGVKVVT